MFILYYRIKGVNEHFPLQNQSSEDMCNVVRENEEEIVKNAMEMEHESGMGIGCLVENMKPHILSELCLLQKEHSIPSLKECHHSGTMRYNVVNVV